jgi:hypothetical protein
LAGVYVLVPIWLGAPRPAWWPRWASHGKV